MAVPLVQIVLRTANIMALNRTWNELQFLNKELLN